MNTARQRKGCFGRGVLDLAEIEPAIFLVWMYRKVGIPWDHGWKALTWCKVAYGAEDRAGCRCRSRKVASYGLHGSHFLRILCRCVDLYIGGSEDVCHVVSMRVYAMLGVDVCFGHATDSFWILSDFTMDSPAECPSVTTNHIQSHL